MFINVYIHQGKHTYTNRHHFQVRPRLSIINWQQFVGFLKLQVSFAKEPYKRAYIPQKNRQQFVGSID